MQIHLRHMKRAARPPNTVGLGYEPDPPNRSALLQQVPASPLISAFSAHRPETLAAGRALFVEGDPGSDIHLLESGLIALSHIQPNGKRMIASFIVSNDVFSLSHDGTRLLTAEALQECRLRRVHRVELSHLPANQFEAVKGAVDREPWDIQTETLMHLHKDADESISYFLVRLAGRLIGPTSRGSRVRLDMSRVDIADHLGLTVETVCRGLKRLRSDRVIDAAGPHNVIILEPEQLKRRAGLGPDSD
ncbi:Crp/Fnr family transcriptional regulator [Rhizobium sp. EC-SD404]|uniref:Crp/Fnr family transcriptional regulator n=1 Tax=Rhizobium sp. EC-SD404 TaxID=2038389 RepID=UPI0012558E14|nr:Crp/Fnr family transcriptional regulator [Rhizobium sp. EC-SD404]VVT03411.1 putative Crp/Fnr family transcriptional regulator [Rhizobium sp. EC-SD404]